MLHQQPAARLQARDRLGGYRRIGRQPIAAISERQARLKTHPVTGQMRIGRINLRRITHHQIPDRFIRQAIKPARAAHGDVVASQRIAVTERHSGGCGRHINRQ